MKSLVCIALVAAAMTSSAFAQSGDGKNSACRADVQKLCPGIKPGGGRIKECMKAHKDEVSDGCKTFLKEKRAEHKSKNADSQSSSNDRTTQGIRAST